MSTNAALETRWQNERDRLLIPVLEVTSAEIPASDKLRLPSSSACSSFTPRAICCKIASVRLLQNSSTRRVRFRQADKLDRRGLHETYYTRAFWRTHAAGSSGALLKLVNLNVLTLAWKAALGTPAPDRRNSISELLGATNSIKHT